MEPRLPIGGPRRLRPVAAGFVKTKEFWIFQCPIVIQSIVAPIPTLWLPAFATSMGMSATTGALAVALLNLASTCGFLLQGRLVDRFHVSWAILMSTIGSILAVFVVWGCVTHEATLLIFAMLFGLFGVGYPGHWPGCAGELRKTSPNIDTGMVLSLLCAGKGVGSILAGPVSERLLSGKPWHDAGLAYGTAYGSTIVFTGICVLLGGAGALPPLFASLRTAFKDTRVPEFSFVKALIR
jgi:predicted MFS family arabinose efflux permease